MRTLWPYLILYKRHIGLLIAGIILTIITLLASIGLLTLSGWFLSACALAGVAGLYSFNYMLPAAGVRGAAIIRTAGRYFERLISHDATFRVLQHLRVFTFSQLLPLSPGGLARFRHGELLNRVVADVDTLDHLYLRVIAPLAGALAVILVVTVSLSWLDLRLALTLGGIMLFTVLILPPLFYRAGKPGGENITQMRGQYRQQLTAWLQGQAELKLFSASERYRAQMDKTEQQWQDAQRRQMSLTALSQVLMLLVSAVTILCMILLASASIDHHNQSGALIALFVFCALAAFEAITPAIGAFQHLGQVMASAQRMTQICEQPPVVTFTQGTEQHFEQVALSLDQITFRYPQQSAPALENVSLQVDAGAHIAIIGSTGCGKSTLLQLLTRAWDPDQGEILLNNQPLSRLNETTLRRAISVVPQRVHLFSATLRDNLRLASPTASDNQLIATLRQVGLDKLLLDSGLDCWLGEGGRQLSGGELRRLAIARALLHDAPLMLLDEPTEGLDATTESQILDLLHRVMQGKTVLMVTHRLRGLSRFNQIVIIDNGKMIAQGDPLTLLVQRVSVYKGK
ncbi:cysteine/glutathione ABC transporter ATP-binding protein/permease CydC [Enterobacteriaceae bacterium ESL0689]|nr:cysteine/glutathione ABC transporter ATP-binding protein/permease CydC [Enterobacteriaceae bacterium ESL0689]